jgi:uncharacterized protein
VGSPRFYREWAGGDRLVRFSACHLDTDLQIGVDPGSYSCVMPRRCRRLIREIRSLLEDYGADCPEFITSLSPVPARRNAPGIIRRMARAGRLAGVGPMAAVAGAVAREVGCMLLREFGVREVVVENGGDIFMRMHSPLLVSIYAGTSPLSARVGLQICDPGRPLGLCTSSGTVGHSLSFGRADAAVVACRDAALADAYATAWANEVHSAGDIPRTLEQMKGKRPIRSAVIIVGGQLGIVGRYALRPLGGKRRPLMRG